MRAHAIVVSLTASLLLLCGCTPSPVPQAPSASPDPLPGVVASPSPRPSPSPSPSSTGTDDGREAEVPVDTAPSAVTCASLLDEQTTSDFAAAADDGWTYLHDFEQRMIDQGNLVAKFVEFGGVACQWGHPSTDNIFSYAWSPITESDARQVEHDFTAQGYRQTGEFGGRLHCDAPHDSSLEYDHCFLFLEGEWLYSTARSEFGMLLAQAHRS